MEETKNQEQVENDANWLKEVAAKSWEPELLVSGAAIYLSSNLPTWINKLHDFYMFDLMVDSNSPSSLLPILAIAVLKCISYLLFATFIFHFVLRAFWVAVIGLLSVFPQGIKYEQLPYNEHFKENIEKRLGTLQDYANRLDKTCSVVLSIAFLVALLMIGVSGIYISIFLLFEVSSMLIPTEIFVQYERVVYFTIMSLMMVFAIFMLILNLDAVKNTNFAKKFQFKFYWTTNAITFPIIYKALQRVSLVFLSNMPKKKYYIFIIVSGLIFVILLLFVLFQQFNDTIFRNRNFYSEGSPMHRMNRSYYENLKDESLANLRATIQSDIVKDDFLKIYIAYPKRLDKQLKQFCSPLVLPDSLKKKEKQERLDAYSLDCFQKFFKIYINDSLYVEPEYAFYQHPQNSEIGLLTYLHTENFKTGKNILKINKLTTDSLKKEEEHCLIPFWYVPD